MDVLTWDDVWEDLVKRPGVDHVLGAAYVAWARALYRHPVSHVRSAMLNCDRQRRPALRIYDHEAQYCAEDELEREEIFELVREAVARLSSKTRDFAGALGEGESLAQATRRLGLNQYGRARHVEELRWALSRFARHA